MKILLFLYACLTLITFVCAIIYLYKFIQCANKTKNLDTPIWAFIFTVIMMSPLIFILSMFPVLSQIQLYKESLVIENSCKQILGGIE